MQGKVCTIKSKDSSAVYRVDNYANVIEGPHEDAYTYIDEEYRKSLETDCCWNRDNGHIELMPLAVVVANDL